MAEMIKLKYKNQKGCVTMKKVISILMTIMMISTTVLADTADGLHEIVSSQSQLKSYTAKTVLTAKVNKPLQIIEDIPEDDYADIDYNMLVNDLINSEAVLEYSYNTSDDYKKIQMSISMACNSPIHINDSLKIDAYAKYGIWLDYNAEDAENPYLTVIVKSPLEKRYEYFDFIEEYGEDVISYINADTIKGISDSIYGAVKNNAKIAKTAKGYTVKFDSDAVNGFINDCTAMIDENVSDPEIKEYLMDSISMDSAILGKDGVTFTITQNSKGNITAVAEKIHLDFNLYDFLTEMDMDTDGLSREKAQIDMTFEAVTEISGHNATTVTIPELTEKNSSPKYHDYYHDYITETSPIFKNDIIYYPLSEVIEITDANVTIDGNKVMFGDAVLECDETKLFISENAVYATEDVLAFIGAYSMNVRYDTNNKVFRLEFDYDETEAGYTYDEYIEDEDTDDYQPPYIYKSFVIDRAPYTKDGVYYMPVYEFINGLGKGEFEFGYKALNFNATTKNADGIKTFAVKDGDRFVTVNGERINIEAPAAEVDGVLNIPASFAGTLGYDGYINNYISLDNKSSHTSYSFNKENPLYSEKLVSPVLWVYVYSDRLPHMENGELFVPLYDLLIEMYDGEFAFTENGMEYTATSENDYGITKVSVSVGDNFVTVDDEKIEFGNTVVREDGIIRVPISFTEALGFEIDWITVDNSGTTYTFTMPNPKYNKE